MMIRRVAPEVALIRKLNAIRKDIQKLKAKAAANSVSFTMKDGSTASITVKELADPHSLYASWIHHNSNPNVRASDTSLLHCLSQSIAGTLEQQFIPFDVFKVRIERQQALKLPT